MYEARRFVRNLPERGASIFVATLQKNGFKDRAVFLPGEHWKQHSLARMEEDEEIILLWMLVAPLKRYLFIRFDDTLTIC